MDELVERFSFKGVAVEKDRVLNIWHRLASKGLAKFVKKEARDKDLTELAQADDVILKDSAAMEDCLYVCNFVGVVIVGNVAIKCFPNYIKDD